MVQFLTFAVGESVGMAEGDLLGLEVSRGSVKSLEVDESSIKLSQLWMQEREFLNKQE